MYLCIRNVLPNSKIMSTQTLYQIALTLLPGVGDVNAKKLTAFCGGAEAVFREQRKALEAIPGVNENTIDAIFDYKILERAEKELTFIENNAIKPIFYLDPDYPKRLQHCADSPIILYCKGECNFNVERSVGIVGTRNITMYGQEMTEKLIADLVDDNVLVVSGLAYGVDTAAHRAALNKGLKTVAVLGHGFQTIYPFSNKTLAHRIEMEGGALLTEHISGIQPDRENFPKRNRIVAGMVDALIVVESALKGGALITAEIASSYNRDVFAIPGRANEIYSAGCNFLIRNNKAALITSAEELRYAMRWDVETKVVPRQMRLFREFSEEEQHIVDVFKDEKIVDIDKIMSSVKLTPSRVATLLLNLEFDGVIMALPGKRYALN